MATSPAPSQENASAASSGRLQPIVTFGEDDSVGKAMLRGVQARRTSHALPSLAENARYHSTVNGLASNTIS